MTTKVAGGESKATEVLKDLLIVQLGLAEIPQHTIREIVGCDMHRVTRIVRHLKRKTKEE
jgi:hypothetical protein